MMARELELIRTKPLDKAGTATDPLNLVGRLYLQVDALLNQLETGAHVTLRERVQAMIAVGRLQVIFVALRKEKNPDESAAGSSVRKYAKAFDAARRRKTGARPALAKPEPELDAGFGDGAEDGLGDGDDNDDAA